MARKSGMWLLLIVLIIVPSTAQVDGSVRAMRLSEPIVIDGQLTDAGWAGIPTVEALLEVDPRENARASQRTEIRFAYDDEFLYAGFVCYDTNMEEVRATLTERDNMFQDDYTFLILDAFGDAQKAYVFLVNPRNIQADALMSQGGSNEDYSYEMIWYSAVSQNAQAWTVELAIPFKSIRFPDVPEQSWRIITGRNYPRDTRATLAIAPYDRNNPCLLCQATPLTGIRGVSPGLSLEVLPYAIMTQQGSVQNSADPASPFEQGDILGRAGVGLKVTPTPDITVEGVLNPDFSQIESDAAQISVNTTFALFYPERRPFFLEGSDLFRPGIQDFGGPALQVFYSRTVNDPLVAAKVIGKSGGWAYGIISASDRNTNILVPGEEESDFGATGRNSLVNVGRVRYDLGGSSYIGAMATTRHFSGDGANLVGGVDWNYRFWENYSFRGVVFGSQTDELNAPEILTDGRTFGTTSTTATLDGQSYAGLAARFQLGRSAREVNYSISVEDISPLFQAQNGFIARTNKRTLSVSYGRTYYPEEGGLVTKFDASVTTGFQLNYAGQRKERFLFINTTTQLRGQINVSLGGMALNQELFRGVYFRNMPRLFASVYANPVSYLETSLNVEAGNFAYRRVTPPELGYGHNISFSAKVLFTERFNVSLQYSRSRLSSSETGNLYFDGNIYRTTAVYQFSPEMFVRLIGQYDSFDQAVNIYPLFSLKLNPFTVFYAGASGDAKDFGGTTGFRTTQTNYFVKLQYLIQG